MDKLRPYKFEEGEILLIHKPLEWTSFDVIKKLRRHLGAKVGHAGTLDPLAEGLLILCTGKKTKEISSIQGAEKEYTGTICLGAERPSCDKETEISKTYPLEGINHEMIVEAAHYFEGGYKQVPPVFSAKKVNGKRAYDLARKGKEVNLEGNDVEVMRFEIVSVSLPMVYFRVVCGKGTYIRSLARDHGNQLGCGGYLETLTRTRIGDFRLENAMSPDDLIRQLSTYADPLTKKYA